MNAYTFWCQNDACPVEVLEQGKDDTEKKQKEMVNANSVQSLVRFRT
jgi:hypothetical protein